MIREAALTYARADKAMVCWTLGITEHHNAVDNVLALINLALLTGHVGRWGCGCNPLRGQNNVQGGGDMGAIPNKLPGFQDIEQDAEARERIGRLWGVTIQPTVRLQPDRDAARDVAARAHVALRHRREPGAVGRRPAPRQDALAGLDHLVVQEIVLTKTAEIAHVVLPAAATWCEGEGTVTNSERRVQRVRKVVEPPDGARDELWIISEIARRLGHDWGMPTAEEVWNEFRVVAPHFAGGMSYARLEALGGIQWPCPDESHPGRDVPARPPVGGAAPRPRRRRSRVVHHDPPVEQPDDEYPFAADDGPPARVVQHRRADGRLRLAAAPRRDARHLARGRRASRHRRRRPRARSRRGAAASKRRRESTTALRAGMVFMTLHFPDEVATNLLTIDASDPKSGTAEFKACAGARASRAIGPSVDDTGERRGEGAH